MRPPAAKDSSSGWGRTTTRPVCSSTLIGFSEPASSDRSAGGSGSIIGSSLPERLLGQLQRDRQVAVDVVTGQEQLITLVDFEVGETLGVHPPHVDLQAHAVRALSPDGAALEGDATVADERDHRRALLGAERGV